jgi:hypothetical protein
MLAYKDDVTTALNNNTIALNRLGVSLENKKGKEEDEK